MKITRRAWVLLWLCSLVAIAQNNILSQERDVQPLSFGDLIALSSTAKPEGDLLIRLNQVLTTPVVDNSASDAGARPHRPTVGNVGPVLRLGLWNIERVFNFQLIRSALTNTTDFENAADNLGGAESSRRERIESQLATLQDADVLVLNEVDLGMKRTQYRDVARELAAALHMNYAYGVEFMEVDPIFTRITASNVCTIFSSNNA